MIPFTNVKNDPRIARASGICMALPEATCARSGRDRTFKIRNKTFAYVMDDSAEDGLLAVCFKTDPGRAGTLARTHSDKYFIPRHMPGSDWLAIRVDRAKIDWEEVRQHIRNSYKLVAPKTVAAIA
jgi:predicted DNA-binding protein (MmcQ/YjbR family)